MNVKYDYKLDVLIIDISGKDISVPLKDYRNWLLDTHPILCKNHFIRALSIGGKTKFTFDWQSIFATAERYKYLKNFINEQVK